MFDNWNVKQGRFCYKRGHKQQKYLTNVKKEDGTAARAAFGASGRSNATLGELPLQETRSLTEFLTIGLLSRVGFCAQAQKRSQQQK